MEFINTVTGKKVYGVPMDAYRAIKEQRKENRERSERIATEAQKAREHLYCDEVDR